MRGSKRIKLYPYAVDITDEDGNVHTYDVQASSPIIASVKARWDHADKTGERGIRDASDRIAVRQP